MRILALTVAGFGPYRSEQRVDFRRFDDDGIFLIAGRTGAGKSSILDAICFALYGDVPRFERRESQVRSQHCGPADPSVVELEFQVRDTVYRIRRTPRYERLKRSGSGTTTAEPEAELAVVEQDGPRVIATRPKDVGIALGELLPISKDQFLQVILLAQNRFQEFLLAPTDKRRELLRTLFGTDRFQRLERELNELRTRLGADLEAAAKEIAARAEAVAEQTGAEVPAEPAADWFAALADAADATATAGESAAAAARGALEAAEAGLAAVVRTASLQDRRDDARRRLTALAAEVERVDLLRARLAAARRAEAVAPRLDARADARGAVAAAQERRAAAAEALRRHPARPPAPTEPAARIEALLTERGELAHPLVLERELPDREAALSAATLEAGAAVSGIAALEADLAALPSRLAALDAELTATATVAATAGAARGAVDELRAALESAERAERLGAEARSAQELEAAAASEAAGAAARLDALLTQRIAGQSAELAAALSAGEPCPVCGSREHPAPAAAGAPLVTAEDVETARADSATAQAALAAAAAAVREAERRLAAAQAETRGRTREEVAALLPDAREALRLAAEAEDRLGALREARGETEAAARAAEQRLADARERRAGAETRATALAEGVARDRAAVLAARGDHDSVAARAGALEEELHAVRAATAADAALRQAEGDLAAAEDALAVALAEQGFPDAAAAEAARLTPAGEREADAAVRGHEQAVAAAGAVLEEPALAGLPEDRADPTPARAARDDAAARFEAAVAEAGARREAAKAVRAASAAAIALIASSAAAGERYRQVRDLAATVRGDEPNTRRIRLETYVLAAQLEQIIAAANLRLERMTAGRYALDLDDERQHRNVETGLGIGVRDAHTGLVRQAASLSGGEMFLASLALALGLAEVVSAQAGGIRLDTLFVDEGFGSLDAETLDTAMAALDDLRTGGRTIGLISHVESMQERIPAKLAVEVLPSGDSRVVQPAA